VASVEEFLAENPGVEEGSALAATSPSKLSFAVVLVAISAQVVRFTHYGTTYIVDRGAVLDIESAADGQTVTLTVDRGTSFQATQTVAAEDLDHAIPFGLARPLTGFVRPPSTQRDVAWRRSHDVPTLQEVLAQYATESFSYGDTNSNGIADDSGPNDSITDYA
jgi:hypothetical protein